jgi:hypothetical protein
MLTAEERYKLARKEMACPDCGSDLELKPMQQIDPFHAEDYLPDHVGIKCTGYDYAKRLQPPECPFWAFAGERSTQAAE